MRVEPLGESALILRDLPLPAPVAATLLDGTPGVVEAWAAFDTVGVVLDGVVAVDFAAALSIQAVQEPGRLYTIPVLYDGEDREEVAKRCGLQPAEVALFHAAETYECRAVGFCPGFGYLAPLPAPLASLPRRDTPRPRVAPGSVALAAGMTAVYPLERPGGWWLVGRTPLTLVDEADGYFPLRAGDRVRFVAIGPDEFARRKGGRLESATSPHHALRLGN